MKAYQALYQHLQAAGAHAWAEILPLQLQQAFNPQQHGDLDKWQQVVDQLPVLHATDIDLLNTVRIGNHSELTNQTAEALASELMKLHPWRKGPYSLFGIEIDCEWRSDWKWDRLKTEISSLANRRVLDVGCGNGYHCWRMLGSGAQLVIGIDPTLLSVMQFQAIQKLHGEAPIFVLPLAFEDLPGNLGCFDSVFSMGVLYHRRSPIDHLLDLKACLRPGGQLILETLVVAGDHDRVLTPENRYAQMRNVWFLPSCEALMIWLQRCGFKNIRLIDVCKTTLEEQRSTPWMHFHSLQQFLDPNDHNLTCEGLPAPMRAILLAETE